MTKTTVRDMYEILRENQGSDWVRIADLQAMTGATQAELDAVITELEATDDRFRAEPEPFGFRITPQDRRHAVVIGGEPRHLITWG